MIAGKISIICVNACYAPLTATEKAKMTIEKCNQSCVTHVVIDGNPKAFASTVTRRDIPSYLVKTKFTVSSSSQGAAS